MMGVPASPSGYSAEPEPSSTVSAVPVSIPNADEWTERVRLAIASGAVETKDGTHRYIRNAMFCLLNDCCSPLSLLRQRERAYENRDDNALQEIMAQIQANCDRAAQGIEAGTATTTQIGVVHESPVAASDAPNPYTVKGTE